MVKDGDYVVWFKSDRGDGTGQIRLENGKLLGCDSFFDYEGTCDTDADTFNADTFNAVIKTKRHTDGPETVFGSDEVVIRLSGKFQEFTGSGVGTVDDMPDATIGTTLIPVGKEAPRSQTHVNRAFRPDLLPKRPSR
jgi:hypothetical protein